MPCRTGRYCAVLCGAVPCSAVLRALCCTFSTCQVSFVISPVQLLYAPGTILLNRKRNAFTAQLSLARAQQRSAVRCRTCETVQLFCDFFLHLSFLVAPSLMSYPRCQLSLAWRIISSALLSRAHRTASSAAQRRAVPRGTVPCRALPCPARSLPGGAVLCGAVPCCAVLCAFRCTFPTCQVSFELSYYPYYYCCTHQLLTGILLNYNKKKCSMEL